MFANEICSHRDKKSLVNEVTTLRRHLEAHHSVSWLVLGLSFISKLDFCQGKYHKWAQDANFESRLPGDIKKRKAATEHATRTLDRDLKEKKLKDRVVPYTDKLFSQVAIEWLVATDQVRKILGVVLLSNTNISAGSQYELSNTRNSRK